LRRLFASSEFVVRDFERSGFINSQPKQGYNAPMRAISLATIVLFAIVPSTFATSGLKADADAILAKASKTTDIRAAGSAPFLLLAKVRLEQEDKSVEGLYAIAWAGSDRFRNVIRFPNFTEIEVVTSDTRYRQRSTEAMPILIWELQRLMNSFVRFQLDPQDKITSIKTRRTAGLDLTCVQVQGPVENTKLCLNSVTNELQTIDKGMSLYSLESFREHYEFSDYRLFASKKFPRQLSFRGWKQRTIEVRIEKLIQADAFPTDEFTPPQGAERSHFCEKPENTGELMPSTGNAIPVGLRDVEVEMYFQVSPLGGVRFAEVIQSSAPLKNKEILNWFVGTHFPIKKCAGTPIAYETVVSLMSGH
jgi:hypothetical protein